MGPWTLRENKALELANHSARYIGYKHKTYQYYVIRVFDFQHDDLPPFNHLYDKSEFSILKKLPIQVQ